VSDLLYQALHDPSFWHAHAALDTLRQRRPAPADVGPALTAALHDSEPRVRRRAVRAIELLLPPAEAVTPLRQMLDDSAWDVRRAAVQVLGRLGQDAAIALHELTGLLRDAVSGVRAAAAEALGRLADALPLGGEHEVVDGLLDHVQDADDVVREAVVQALLRLPVAPERLLPGYIEALHDPLPAVRILAAEALGRAGANDPSVEAALLAALRDPNRAVRETVIRTLEAVGTARAVEVLLPLLEGELRSLAARALAALARRQPETEARLLALLRERTESRAGAGQALGLLGSSAALADLCRESRTGNLLSRRRAIRALGWFVSQPAEALRELDAALRDSHWRIRKTAAESLATFGAAALPVLPALLKRRYDQERCVRVAATWALERIVPHLSPTDQRWLAFLTDPTRSPARNLRRALARPDLPVEVLTDFVATCRRRALWHASQRGETTLETETKSAWRAARLAALQAGGKASCRATDPEKGKLATRAARIAEHAWQIACLWSLLHPPSEEREVITPG
jgi:HEAT repeat protein